MKAQKKITRITIKTAEVTVFHKPHPAISAWCEPCRERVPFVTPGEACALSGISQQSLNRRVEAEEVHRTETASGALLICLNSLLKRRASTSQEEIPINETHSGEERR